MFGNASMILTNVSVVDEVLMIFSSIFSRFKSRFGVSLDLTHVISDSLT